MVDITGTENSETLNGSVGNDNIFGLGGDDTLNGLTGNDTLDGGDGNDTANGDAGDDTIIVSGVGSDTANGGLDTDRLVIDYSAASAGLGNNGGPGANVPLGGFDGTLNDFSGRSVSYSSIEHFTISTGSGSDSITVASGNDIVNLGSGDDGVNVSSGMDQADGGIGEDGISADQSATTAAVLWNLQTNTYSGAAGTAFTNFEYFGTVTTGSGNDVLVSQNIARNETFNLGEGNDSATVRSGADTVNGGTGDDRLIIDYSTASAGLGNNGGPSANGSGGFDGTFNDFSGRSVGYSSIEHFTITTGSGIDSVTTAAGNDVVNLGTGDDGVNVGSGMDQADGGIGEDGISADQSAATAAVLWNLQANTYTGAAGTGFTNFEYFGNVTTGSGNDVLVSRDIARNETFNLGGGNDSATVLNGGDQVNGGTGDDRLIIDYSSASAALGNNGMGVDGLGGFNGQFNDFSGRAVTYTSIEHFTVTTGTGGDNITTAAGDDVVTLGAGDDFTNVGSGNDTANGGNNLDLTRGVDGISADLSAAAGAINWNLQANTYSGPIGNFTNFEFFGTVTTGGGNDTLVGFDIARDETINLGGGNDSAAVLNGNDTVNGGAGSDRLVIDYTPSVNDLVNNGGPGVNGIGGFDGQFNNFVGRSVSYTSIEHFTITSGAGNDSITTATGDDIVNLGIGNDGVNVGSGVDQADGGIGEDGVSADQSAATVAVLWNLQANTYSGATGTGFTNFEYFGNVTTGSGNDVLVTQNIARGETINLGGGNDSVTVLNGGDQVNGGTGDDRLIIDYTSAGAALVNNGMGVDGIGGFNGQFNDFSGRAVTYTSIEHFTISTGSGADNVTTGTGNDVVNLGANNDFTNVGSGNDNADGGVGEDGVSADQSVATVAVLWNLQTNSYSGVAGTSFTNFEFFGTVSTGGGNDVLVSQNIARDETFNLGGGDDSATVLRGNDTVNGGTGDDRLIIDYSTASAALGNNGGPSVNGIGGFNGQFNDFSGRSATYTSIEHFTISTGSGGDNITTGAGNDIINLGAGSNAANSGDGDDVVGVMGGTSAATTGTSTLILGIGNDRAVADFRLVATEAVTNTATTVSIAGAVRVTHSGAEAFSIFAGGGNDTLTGGTGNDVLGAGTGVDTLTGGDGDDTLYFAAGGFGAGDSASGGIGRDILALQGVYGPTTLSSAQVTGVEVLALMSGTDNFLGGATGTANSYNIIADESFVGAGQALLVAANGLGANETLVFNGLGETNGSFVLLGGAGADSLTGGAGNDQLNGGAGADTLTGWLGNDVYFVTAGDSVVEAAGEGFDAVYVEGAAFTLAAGSSVELLGAVNSAGAAGIVLTGNDLAQTIAGTEGADTLNGNGGNDFLRGGGGDDQLNGGTGNDVLHGGAGNDTYAVEGWMDVVMDGAGGGADTVNTTGSFAIWESNEIELLIAAGASAGVALYGNGQAQTITGGAFSDQLIGGGGADTLNGGLGNDVIDGGAGADAMAGGGGNDIYFVSEAGDTVTEAAGEGFDSVYAASSFALAATSEVEILAAQIPSGTGALDLTGSNGTQTITGNDGANTLLGLGGADFIRGGGGADILDGGAGQDILTGGAGADTFRFGAATDSALAAPDQIRDFLSGTDKIDLTLIDANVNADGDQAFSWIGDGAFTGAAGQLRYQVINGQIYVSGDTNGDGAADFAIVLNNTTTIVEGDFWP